ncbi:hypothetical protein EV650_0942 [Kribbella kalugense]|uniref:Uncharacterized protein n=1 Tax=Kribbella kalugense TaxID=2512221 RepID=A0A4R7ZVI8_9ACTN|nr:hypothetical protein EV650_0942 [Kribbella kalugense]
MTVTTRETWPSRSRFQSSRESEARLLLLVDAFSRKSKGEPRFLEGRVKLAKLDFLLRYPVHLRKVLIKHGVDADRLEDLEENDAPLDNRMMRYRYGPWDPSYYAVLGSLIGRGLVEVEPLPGSGGFGYRTTALGAGLAEQLLADEIFLKIGDRAKLLRRYLDKSGRTLMGYVYELPEVADATWLDDIR